MGDVGHCPTPGFRKTLPIREKALSSREHGSPVARGCASAARAGCRKSSWLCAKELGKEQLQVLSLPRASVHP